MEEMLKRFMLLQQDTHARDYGTLFVVLASSSYSASVLAT